VKKEMSVKHPVYSVGDEVYVVSLSFIDRVKGEPIQGEVTKVGRKYFYVKFGWQTERFYIKDNRHDRYSPMYRLFPSMQAFKDHVAYGKLFGKLQQAFVYSGVINADLGQLRQIAKILGIEENDDEN